MRTRVNLSKRPFANRRLFWIIIGSVGLVTAWFAFYISTEKSLATAKADRLAQQVIGKEEELTKLKEKRIAAEKESIETVLTPQESIELAAARRLIHNKAFAWNRLIGDIEKYVPNKTRITNLKLTEVYNLGQGMSAMVEIKALGATADQLTEMMTRLNESGGVFAIEKSGQDQVDENNEVPFTIFVLYRPQGGDLQ